MLSNRQIDRFWNKINIVSLDSCWIWNSGCNQRGYGQVSFNGRNFRAHRIAAWLLGFIESPSATETDLLLHECDSPPCCNPTHWEVGTQAKNIQDAYNRGRIALRSGQDRFGAKLTNKEANRIKLSKEPQRILAGQYNVNQRVIWRIRNGEAYI